MTQGSGEREATRGRSEGRERWSVQQKAELVLRLLRGEDLVELSREEDPEHGGRDTIRRYRPERRGADSGEGDDTRPVGVLASLNPQVPSIDLGSHEGSRVHRRKLRRIRAEGVVRRKGLHRPPRMRACPLVPSARCGGHPAFVLEVQAMHQFQIKGRRRRP